MALLERDYLLRLERLTVACRKTLVGAMKGERRSRRRGISSEFADYRNYVPGDDIRFIDWNIYGRLDQLFIKLFEEEEDLRIHLLVDASESMRFGVPPKIDHVRRIAASIGYVGLVGMDRVRVHVLGAPGVRSFSPGLRGRRMAGRLFDFCEGIAAEGPLSLNAGLRQFALQHGDERGVAVILSDFLDPDGYEDGLRYLLGKKLDTYAIHVLGADELEPELVGDLRLLDSETSAAAEVSMSAPLLEAYRARLARFCGTLKDHCTARGVPYFFISTATPFETVALSYLRRGGLLR